MDGGENSQLQHRAIVYCLVPAELTLTLRDLLRDAFRADDSVRVISESRLMDRRSGADRRDPLGHPPAVERRRIRSRTGRRVDERRASFVPVDPRSVPRKAQAFLDQLVFVERTEPSTQRVEDADTSRIVARIQAGDMAAFNILYMRYFDRVYGYLRLLLGGADAAEEATQQAFVKLLEALPTYEYRRQPFRAWLFVIVRNLAMDELRRSRRLQPVDPRELHQRLDAAPVNDAEQRALEWITDSDLLLFVERLPVAQRQVLLLRYMLDLPIQDVATILDRSPNDVKALQFRAFVFLRKRLQAVGRDRSARDTRVPMRRAFRSARVLRRRRFVLT